MTSDQVFESLLRGNSIIYMVLSNVKKGIEKTHQKIEIRPVIIGGSLKYQASIYEAKKVFHENIDRDKLNLWIKPYLNDYYQQAMIYTVDNDYQVLYSRKGKERVLVKPPSRTLETDMLVHNRQKKYLIPEGVPCDFMVELGVMDEKGVVYKRKYDKFRQLNKYLEFVEPIVDKLGNVESDVIKIIDFGCGKAYLTFALYYYLVKLRGKKLEVIGLDLKEDVIDFCNTIAQKLDYEGLKFEKGDIKDYENKSDVNLVVSLHACDTATDAAIAKAVKWQADVIMAVPCCQHELFNQLDNELMKPLLKNGITKDKMTALVTDTLRTEALEIMGYETQMMEFIDMIHTPKNVLIRALKTNNKRVDRKKVDEYIAFREAWSVSPSIEKYLNPEFNKRLQLNKFNE